MNEVISGTTGAPGTRMGRSWPAAVAVAVVGAIVCWFRVPSVGRYTMYAEDGQIFVQQWLTGHGFPLFEPYAGYQHFLPRLSTWLVVHLVPVSGWGIGVTATACLLTGGTAALVYVFSRDVIDTQVSRIGLAAVTVLIPLAGQEPVGNMANLHWYLLFLTPWLLLATPRSTAGTVAMCLVALASTLTESQAVIFAPIAIWRLVSSPAARPVMVCWFVGVGGQLLAFLLAPRALSGGGWPPPMSVIKGYLANVSLTIDAGTAERAGAVIVGLGWWAAGVSMLVFLAAGLFAVLFGRPMVRVAVITLLAGSVVTWTLAFVLNNASIYYYSLMTPDQLETIPLTRWGTTGSMMVAATVPLAAGVLSQRWPTWGRPAGIAAVGVLVAAMMTGFVSPTSPRVGAPWADQVAVARNSCAVTGLPVRLAIPPEHWGVVLSCAELR